MSARAQHPRHFGQEFREVGVEVRGLNVDQRIKGFVGEGQSLGVTLHEIQVGQVVPVFGELDARGVQVQSGVGSRVLSAYQI